MLLLLVVGQLEERMHRDARGIDLVVGAKGSPMQLILAGIYHLDAPTGNIPLAAAQSLAKNRMVKQAMPLALGDSWKGYRIVGAGNEYAEHYGADAARRAASTRSRWKRCSAPKSRRAPASAWAARSSARTASAASGDEHERAPYTVVGVLAKTGSVLDRLVLTSIESVWQVHEEHQGPQDEADRKALEEAREVTVVLVQYASPLAAATLPRADQLAERAAGRLAGVRDRAAVPHRRRRRRGAARASPLVLILAAGLSVFIALYTALEERRYDLAVMRTLGASPRQAVRPADRRRRCVLRCWARSLGLVLGHALAVGAGRLAREPAAIPGDRPGMAARGALARRLALGVGVVAALLPAWRAYRTDVSRTLAQG